MRKQVAHIAVMVATIPAWTTVHAQSAIDAGAFHAKVVELYSFEPHRLTSEQIKAKSAALDEFRNYVTRERAAALTIERRGAHCVRRPDGENPGEAMSALRRQVNRDREGSARSVVLK